MGWKPWLFLLLTAPIIGGIFWVFASAALPEKTSDEAIAVEASEKIPLTEPLVTFVDPWKGASSPNVTIIEYGDYACPYCRQAKVTIERILSERGDVRFVWKDLPSSLHSGADIAAEAAHCAKDQGRFWDYHEMLFELGLQFNHTALTLTANELGLDLDRFGTCLSGRDKKPLIERAVNEAEALDIDGIPYFFINGKGYSGQMSYERFEEIISAL